MHFPDFPFIKEIMVLVNLVLSGLVLSAVSARFIYASVSLEGQAFWIIRTSPVDMNRFIRSKFLYGFIPVTLLMLSLVFLHKSRYEYQRNSGVSVAWNSPYALHLCERARHRIWRNISKVQIREHCFCIHEPRGMAFYAHCIQCCYCHIVP